MKPKFITSCCGKDIDDCPGCPGNMVLVRKDEDMKESKSLDHILAKINIGTVTAEDFNNLISEATPESTRDRVRRRMNHNNDIARSHHDEHGHSRTSLPTMSARVDPKRTRSNRTQMQHGGRMGHRHSARTQKRTMSRSLKEALLFFRDNIGKEINEELMAGVDKGLVRTLASKLMSKPGINRDWLFELYNTIGEVCQN